jgi:L-ascorbate metabolism protein UlaG (beta-lactamase superfamily)
VFLLHTAIVSVAIYFSLHFLSGGYLTRLDVAFVPIVIVSVIWGMISAVAGQEQRDAAAAEKDC